MVRYKKWACSKSKCVHCGKFFMNSKKARHQKSKKCRKARGITSSPRKIRTDKGKCRKSVKSVL